MIYHCKIKNRIILACTYFLFALVVFLYLVTDNAIISAVISLECEFPEVGHCSFLTCEI